MDGRLGKYAAERSLLEQPYIKDPKKSVGQHIKEIISQLGERLFEEQQGLLTCSGRAHCCLMPYKPHL